MHKSFAAVAAVTLGWVVVGFSCTPELSDNSTAAATAVTTGASGAGNAGAVGGAGGDTGGGGAGGDGGAGGAGGVHGCQVANAVDRTGQATVLINDVNDWTFNHNACVRVDPGTVVRWEGNFTLHPVVGGVTPNEDTSSPIAGNTPANGAVEVTFPDPGDFPYFCGVHTATMTGVVFVEGAGGAGGTGGAGGAGGNGGGGGSGGAGGN